MDGRSMKTEKHPNFDKLRKRAQAAPIWAKAIGGIVMLPLGLLLMPIIGITVLGYAVWEQVFGHDGDDSIYY